MLHACGAIILGILVFLTGCAASAPPATVAISAPPQWYAPLPAAAPSGQPSTTSSLPHQGSLTGLSDWWAQQADPLLVELITAAQSASPSVVTARSNIEQARASRAVSEAALLPKLDVAATLSRSMSAPVNRTVIPPIVNFGQVSPQTSWELDLFGQNRASVNADSERLLGSEALWHEARILVAAEVASQYYSWRACTQLLQGVQADAASRLETARLTGLLSQAGLGAPATTALARASAAEASSRLTQQRTQCELGVKTLVGLTAWAEPVLRLKLQAAPNGGTPHRTVNVATVPAAVLAQRPDIFNAARALNAASFEVGSARAQRYPRLSLSGNVGYNETKTRGFTQRFSTWSVGPVALTVPIFDGGASLANLDAAKARYDAAAGQYRGSVRQAVREVEEALVNLQSTADRTSDARTAAEGYAVSLAAIEARFKAGLASLFELEDARRSQLAALASVINLDLERTNAWIALYKALGGGWTPDAPLANPMVFEIPEAALPAWP